jgi:hypothetical protein
VNLRGGLYCQQRRGPAHATVLCVEGQTGLSPGTAPPPVSAGDTPTSHTRGAAGLRPQTHKDVLHLRRLGRSMPAGAQRLSRGQTLSWRPHTQHIAHSSTRLTESTQDKMCDGYLSVRVAKPAAGPPNLRAHNTPSLANSISHLWSINTCAQLICQESMPNCTVVFPVAV